MVPAGLPCLKTALKTSISRRGKEMNEASMREDPDVEVENPETISCVSARWFVGFRDHDQIT